MGAVDDVGSSPHTRGAPRSILNPMSGGRIIPAYAGSTRVSLGLCRSLEDHPRIRGEHDDSDQYVIDGLGSSPHTRGAHPKTERGLHRERIIPAYAGSTGFGRFWRRRDRDHPRIRGEHGTGPRRGRCRGDHPRIRGEHSTDSGPFHDVSGSSPHTRGAPRSIPLSCPFGRDHPRIRGEHTAPSCAAPDSSGSSPHTRGAPGAAAAAHVAQRIIPAYAGSTPAALPGDQAGLDHPRIRGEHLPPEPRKRARNGSSPHTRGAQGSDGCFHLMYRIIPAYAGSTTLNRPISTPLPDHPRIRGEHIKSGFGAIKDGGSSPHTRGAPP